MRNYSKKYVSGKPKHLKNAWYDEYVKIRKYTQVLYQKVEHTHFKIHLKIRIPI